MSSDISESPWGQNFSWPRTTEIDQEWKDLGVGLAQLLRVWWTWDTLSGLSQLPSHFCETGIQIKWGDSQGSSRFSILCQWKYINVFLALAAMLNLEKWPGIHFLLHCHSPSWPLLSFLSHLAFPDLPALLQPHLSLRGFLCTCFLI